MGLEGINTCFIINPIDEPGKKLNSGDEFMKLNIFNEQTVRNKCFSINEVVSAFTLLCPLVPVWIEIAAMERRGDTLFVRLDCSRRFRKPSLLRNIETGHPPFKISIK